MVKDKSVSYTSNGSTVEYSYQTSGENEDEKVTSDTVKNGAETAISSAYAYDEDGNITKKAVTLNGETADFINSYDSKGKITSSTAFGNTVNYTYDKDDQLVSSSAVNYNASYAYDVRGNITSKTVNDTTTAFTYANSGWKDRLLAVDGVKLTYDKVGNVLTYGDKNYTWNSGRHLESITDGDNTYSYTYDENGIRTSKTVNGVTTYYNTSNGVILSQTDGTDTMYFQYDTNGTPLGFVYNNVQYFYITNQMGDVVGITDADGNKIAEYTYDDWGKLLSVTGNEIANVNPIRYRGYYYDSETGYYYLQSRYYDANICRFINADVYCNTGTKSLVSTNMFVYCDNNPTYQSDWDGYWAKAAHYDWTYSVARDCKLSISISKIIAKNCRALDEVYPSTAYAKNLTFHDEEKEWQYYHFNKYASGNKDSRKEYADKWLNKAIKEYKKNKNNAYKWLGYALHCLQDIEAHGQIDRGKIIPHHIGNVNGDKRYGADIAIGYEWTDSKKNKLKFVAFSKKRQNAAKTVTKTYINKFLKGIK